MGRARVALAALLAPLALLSGCDSKPGDLPECVIKELWPDKRGEKDDASAIYEARPKLREECCNAIRAFLTKKHAITPNHAESAKAEIKKQADDEDKQKIADENSADPKEKKAAEVDEQKQEEKKAKAKDPTDPTATGTDDAKVAVTSDAEVNKDMEESHMAELQKQFDEAFCNMNCQGDVVGDETIKKSVGKMCTDFKSSLFFGENQEGQQKKREEEKKAEGDPVKKERDNEEASFLDVVQEGLAELAKGAAEEGVEEIRPTATTRPPKELLEITPDGNSIARGEKLLLPRRVQS